MGSPILLGAEGERAKATRIAITRMAIGTLAMFPVGPVKAAFGVPKEQDVPAATTIARLFGIRNIVLGAWALMERDADVDARRRCYQVNAVVDVVDVGVLLWALLRRQGLDRFALSSIGLGSSAAWAWFDLLQELNGAGVVTEVRNTA